MISATAKDNLRSLGSILSLSSQHTLVVINVPIITQDLVLTNFVFLAKHDPSDPIL